MPPKRRNEPDLAPDTYQLEETRLEGDRGVELIIITAVDLETEVEVTTSGRLDDRELLIQDLQKRLRERVALYREHVRRSALRQLELLQDRRS